MTENWRESTDQVQTPNRSIVYHMTYGCSGAQQRILWGRRGFLEWKYFAKKNRLNFATNMNLLLT